MVTKYLVVFAHDGQHGPKALYSDDSGIVEILSELVADEDDEQEFLIVDLDNRDVMVAWFSDGEARVSHQLAHLLEKAKLKLDV